MKDHLQKEQITKLIRIKSSFHLAIKRQGSLKKNEESREKKVRHTIFL